MKPTDPEFEKMLGELFAGPSVLESDAERFQQAARRARQFVVWATVAFFLGYGVLVSAAAVIVLLWLKLFGVI